MQENRRPGRIKEPGYYIPKALRFYEMKNDSITPVLFVVVLALSFIPAFVESLTVEYFALSLISTLAVNLVLSVYMVACILQFTGKPHTLGDCFRIVFRNIFKLVLALVLYDLAVVLGFLLFIIPGVYFYIMFMFNTCTIVDRGEGAVSAFRSSRMLTDGQKGSLFNVVLIFALLRLVVMLLPLPSGSIMISLFILAFASAIISFMQQRLTALLYVDIQYGNVQYPVDKEKDSE